MRNDILTALLAQLETITTANGYLTNIGAKETYWDNYDSDYSGPETVTFRDSEANYESVNAFYDLINGAIGLPTASKDRAIDSMLVSLADLLDYYRTSGDWGDKSVQVHLSTFQLLLRTEGARDPEGTEAILAGLKKVSRKAARG